jgi:hypothetical protein
VEFLCFELGDAPYAIAQEAIADVAPAGAIHKVPLSPKAVLGLAERRGRAIAVIDLPMMLETAPVEAPPAAHLLRLSGPLEGAALFVPAHVSSGTGVPATSGHVWIGGRLHRLLDAEALVKRAGTLN